MSEEIQDTICPYYVQSQCRSCTHMLIGAHASAQKKQARVIEAVKSIGFRPELVKPIVIPQQVMPSRAKAKILVSGTAENPILGLQDQEFHGIELLDCPLHLPIINKVLHFLSQKISEYKLHPYNVQRRTGEFKGIIITSNKTQRELIVKIVVRSLDLKKRLEKLSIDLQNSFPQIKVVSINVQPIPHAILEGPEEILLTQEKYIWETYSHVDVALSSQSFVQVTPEIAEKLYIQVKDWILERNVQSVLDLFCGVGGFSLVCASSVKSVHGYELSQSAVDAANASCVKNNFTHMKYENKSVGLLDPQNLAKPFDLIIVNPPRRGLGAKTCELLLLSDSKYIAYSSCNVDSWAQDCKELKKAYQLQDCVTFDMFPLTEHAEILSIFEKSYSC